MNEKIKILLKNKKREITLVLVSVMVLALFFSGSTMGKEFSSTNIEVSSKIAQPILIVENNPFIKISGKKEKEYYNFKVKNYQENGQVTQIDLEYNIEILSPKEEAISFKLYKDEQEVLLEDDKTSNMKLEKQIKQEDSYQLQIIYDKNSFGHDIIQNVQIKVHSEQLKV